MKQITAPELAQWLADPARDKPVLLDVREGWEVALCQIPGSQTMPMQTVPARLDELDEDAEVVCICHHGGRSMQVAAFLERNGFTKVTNLTGGVHAWSAQVDPTMAQY